eukprot:4256857-Ditylum_brightwellii.AAC.1
MNLEELLYVLPQLTWRLMPVGYLHKQKVLCQNPKQQVFSPVAEAGRAVVYPTSIAMEADACWVLASIEGTMPESKTAAEAGRAVVYPTSVLCCESSFVADAD